MTRDNTLEETNRCRQCNHFIFSLGICGQNLKARFLDDECIFDPSRYMERK